MSELRQQAIGIVETLQGRGFEALFAGGCVRDMLMGHEPVDYDVATNARPDEVAAIFPKTVLVGVKFGVVRVLVDSHDFEVATFRTEHGYLDHRHPQVVEFSDARNDALRRDFTINAILCDPLTGRILDYAGGQDDIRAGIIRTVGEPEKRFEEDYLRLIRAVRFAARFNYRIEDRTFDAIRRNAAKIIDISRERIGQEILKIFGGPRPHVGLQLLSDTGLLAHIMPEVDTMKGVEQPANYHPEGDVFQHSLLALRLMGQARTPEFALAVLLHDVGKPPTFERTPQRIRFSNHTEVGAEIIHRIGRRLRFSNDQIDFISSLARDHMKFVNVCGMKESTLKKCLRGRYFNDLLELHRLDCLASHGDLTAWRFCKQKLEELGREKIYPPRLITGGDLIELGYQPGPVFRKILSATEDAQLEGEIRSKEDAIEFVLHNFPRPERE